MTIRRLDVFFRTQLTLDKPNVFNSTTNLAFSALQHLIGQNKYQSLQGKVSSVPQDAAPLPSYFTTAKKVVAWISAFFLAIALTPIGILTRHLSFLSSDVDQAYSLAFLSQLSPLERTPELITSAFKFLLTKPQAEYIQLLKSFPTELKLSFLSQPAHRSYTNHFLLQMPERERTELLKKLPPAIQGFILSLNDNQDYARAYLRQITQPEFNQLMFYLSADLHVFYVAQKEEKTKKEPLDSYLNLAINSLTQLDSKLKEEKSIIEPWLREFSNHSFYPFPFLLAQQLESNSKIKDRADPALWEKFMSLRQSCSQQLVALELTWNEGVLQKTTQATAMQAVQSAFKINAVFFKELQEKLKNSAVETSEITGWLDQQKLAPNYSYPFSTQPQVLKLMQQVTQTLDKLNPFFEAFSTCTKLLQDRKLENYASEKPPQDHIFINTLMRAMDQVENIANLQTLIKTQSA